MTPSDDLLPADYDPARPTGWVVRSEKAISGIDGTDRLLLAWWKGHSSPICTWVSTLHVDADRYPHHLWAARYRTRAAAEHAMRAMGLQARPDVSVQRLADALVEEGS